MSEVTEHVALADALLSWARELGDGWWTAEQAAEVVGADENAIRSALADLEDLGLVWRSVVERGKFRLTADENGDAGRDARRCTPNGGGRE